MCGIFAIFNKREMKAYRKEAIALAKLLRHRGPDWTGCWMNENNIIVHERLAIVDPDSGDQPLYGRGRRDVLGVNGEIYNHESIRKELEAKGHKFATYSDCEVFVHMYAEKGAKFMESWKINGMYAFVLYDEQEDRFFIARDTIGIIPLYYGYGADGSMWVSSELKPLVGNCPTIKLFPPGMLYDSKTAEMTRFHTPTWWDPRNIPTLQIELSTLRDALIAAVRSHMMSDVPYGVLLSGGLDSSLVASIMSRYCGIRQEAKDGRTPAFWPRLHSFSIGLQESPDLKAAKKVSEFLGTAHHAYVFTVQDGIDALSDVVYNIETYDTTTIRASTPMFLMARKIKASGVKMVLSGEGADEIFGGYLYFHMCPDGKEMHEENIRKVKQLHYYDCLRANKSMMAFGVEGRVPFLDREFMEVAFSMNPIQKMCGKGIIEKNLVRSAFDVRKNGEGADAKPWLPDEVLWRQKEQFSDGVGYSWIDGLKAYADSVVTDFQLKNAPYRFPLNTPATKEQYMGRELYETHFPGREAADTVLWQDSIACSTAAALRWSKSFQNREDDSGRSIIGVHNSAYDSSWDKKQMQQGKAGEAKETSPTKSTGFHTVIKD